MIESIVNKKLEYAGEMGFSEEMKDLLEGLLNKDPT